MRWLLIHQNAGATAWIAQKDMKPGHSLVRELSAAVLRCPVFLVILTDHSRRRAWVRKEIAWALRAEAQGLVEILPVLAGKITDDKIPKRLKGRLYVDFRNRAMAKCREELLKAYLSIKQSFETKA